MALEGLFEVLFGFEFRQAFQFGAVAGGSLGVLRSRRQIFLGFLNLLLFRNISSNLLLFENISSKRFLLFRKNRLYKHILAEGGVVI